MPNITIANTTVTVSRRDSYCLDYEWIIDADGAVVLSDAERPDHIPSLRRRSILGNIIEELGVRSACCHDGNPFNLCRSNLLPIDIRHIGNRFVMLVGGRRVVSASSEAEALEQRRVYYDEC